jgi:protoporphyrinogen IX oxidase
MPSPQNYFFYYSLCKSLHIISVVSWMAGMLYLPRLFVYHASVPVGSDQDTLFKTMERRLLRYIMMPASLATWIFGLLTGFFLGNGTGVIFQEHWFISKFILVCIMTVMHHLFARYFKAFQAGKNNHTPKFFKIMNEVPTILMIIIVFIVVFK